MQQSDRIQLKDTPGLHRLVARHRQDTLDAGVPMPDKHADDTFGIVVLACYVRQNIQVAQQIFRP